MIKNSLFFIVLLAGSASAATVGFTQSFPILQNYVATTGATVVFDDNFLTGSLPSFDPALGSLESFSITWSLAGNFTGALSVPGGYSAAYSGFLLAAGHTLTPTSGSETAWSGGGGTGGGGPAGTAVSSPFTGTGNPLSFSQTFLASDAGSTYDQEVLDAILGTNPVTLEWDTPLTITGSFDTLAVSGTGSVVLTYNYTPVPEASVSLLGLGALIPLLTRRRR